MSKPKRIICYAINGAGLGHVTRLLSVGKWLRRYVTLLDGVVPEVMFLSSSDASDVLADAGFAAFKIPSKTIAKTTGLNKLEYRRLAKHFVWNTLGVFDPDLLVVDTFPSGSFDELFQVLDGPFKKSFIFRKVKAEYAARATFRSAASMYDAIVAPHSPQNCPVEQIGGKQIRCSGEVSQFDQDDFLPRDVVRKQLGVDKGKRLVYLSAGGGGDPGATEQLACLVDALADVPDVHLLVGAGPLYRGPRISAENLTWFDGHSIGKFFAAVDAAICAAGYNTFHELLLARVPVAFFAQAKIADDQNERIESAAAAGACRKLADFKDANSVAATLRDLFDTSVASAMRDSQSKFLVANSARRCAIELLAPLYQPDRLAWVERCLSAKLAKGLEQLGTSQAISDWLTPLLPSDQSAALGLSLVDDLVEQLSEPAAAELRALLVTYEGSDELADFESSLLSLLERVEQFEPEQRLAVSNDLIKTAVATMKKNPRPTSVAWNIWVCQLLQGICEYVEQSLVLEHPLSSLTDRLQVLRVFPRIVDADLSQFFELCQRYRESPVFAGDSVHEVLRSLQLIKMSHQNVRSSMLEDALKNLSAEADLHE